MEGSAVRIGLGYVNGVHEHEMRTLVAERNGRAWRSLADLAARSGAFAETLGKLAWAGACDVLADGPVAGRRRQALWQLGVAVPGTPVRDGTQLALPLEPHAGPELRALSAWERMLADYGSTGVTLREHPLELMRPDLPADLSTSAELERGRHGRRVRVAGLVIARQRPATAKGVTFMLLEDELGTINLIVTPPVHERFRLAVRAEPLVMAYGRLEQREGTANVLVDRIERLERPDLPSAKVKHIEPRRAWSTDDAARRRTCARWPRQATASAAAGADPAGVGSSSTAMRDRNYPHPHPGAGEGLGPHPLLLSSAPDERCRLSQSPNCCPTSPTDDPAAWNAPAMRSP